jgi:hypothetical protein
MIQLNCVLGNWFIITVTSVQLVDLRMHMTYAFIRLISTFNDLFVFYHAKDLVLMDEDKIHAEDELVKENIQMNTIPE